MAAARARSATIRFATEPIRVRLPASVEAIATTSQARPALGRAGMKGLRIRTAGTLLTILERTAVTSERRQGTSRPKFRANAIRFGREQRLLRPGHDNEEAGEQDEQRPVDLAIDAIGLDRSGEEEDRAAEHGGFGGRRAGEKGDRQPRADDAHFIACPACSRRGLRRG